ncbi:hypothetical protein [Pontibacter rugosus]|uniref:Lipoprotein n=1 Tax=Pontibacter rugosus TaxID=1745966 RepID=A0ABW3SQ73_9BACT
MKIKPYLLLLSILCFASCQNQENRNQAEVEQAAGDTTAAAQTPEPQPLDSAYLIIPGKRIGQVEVGMAGSALSATLGKPDSTDAAMGKALLYWTNQKTDQPQHYLVVYTEADFGSDKPTPTVKQIQVNSPQFQTPEGISTGKPLSEIRQKYSQLEPLAYYQNDAKQRVYLYDSQPEGITFEVALPDSLCTAITVHEKGKAITNTYLPVHPATTWLNQP